MTWTGKRDRESLAFIPEIVGWCNHVGQEVSFQIFGDSMNTFGDLRRNACCVPALNLKFFPLTSMAKQVLNLSKLLILCPSFTVY